MHKGEEQQHQSAAEHDPPLPQPRKEQGGKHGAACRAEHVREVDDPSVWLCDDLLPHMADMATLAGLDSVPEGLWRAWADPRVRL